MWGLVRPLRACKSLCERSSSMSFICEVKRADCIVWIRWVKAGLVAQAVMWRPSCVAYRHGWAQLGIVLVVHLERGVGASAGAVAACCVSTEPACAVTLRDRERPARCGRHGAGKAWRRHRRGAGSRGAGSCGVGRGGARRGGP
eukprot:scaffold27066_cov70-Phaeocystis_antarctica.AAC.1